MAFGDPPNGFHPVAWFGRLVAPLTRWAGHGSPRLELLVGFALATAVPLLWTAAWMTVFWGAQPWPWLRFVLGVILIHSTFAIRDLGRVAIDMARALERGQLEQARLGLSCLCSRDPTFLGEEQLAQATIESIAENASDSAIAPFFYLALFGVPGALFYRAVNTLDAMVGYHGRFESLGKASARLDDVLNWIPARLTAWLLLAVGRIQGADFRGGYRVMCNHAERTESPNAGRPMSAMAGLLGVELTKPGAYTLGVAHRSAGPHEIRRAWRIARATLITAAVVTGSVLAWQTVGC